MAELDLRLEEWASAELKSVAADFNHALILFCNGQTLKIVLTKKEGEGFEGLASVGQQKRADQQSECGWEAGRDFAHAVGR